MSVLASGWRDPGEGALGTIEPFCRAQQQEKDVTGDCSLIWPAVQPGSQWIEKNARWRWSPCLRPLRCCMLPFCPCAGCCVPPQLPSPRQLHLCRAEVKGIFLKGWWKASKRLQAEDLSIGIASTGKLSPEGELLVSFHLEKCTNRDIMKISILCKCDCYPGRSTV